MRGAESGQIAGKRLVLDSVAAQIRILVRLEEVLFEAKVIVGIRLERGQDSTDRGPVTTLAEALVGLIFIGHAAASALSLLDAPGTRRTMDLAKAAGFAVLGLLFLTSSLWDPLLLGLLFGSAFLFDGCARLTTTLLVRYRGWLALP